MATDALTDAAIKKAKPSAKPVRMFDGKGLSLEVASGGSKWWRLKYRLDEKEKLDGDTSASGGARRARDRAFNPPGVRTEFPRWGRDRPV